MRRAGAVDARQRRTRRTATAIMNAPPTRFQKAVRAFAAVWLSTMRNALDGHFGQLVSVGVESTSRLVRLASSAVGYPIATIRRSALDSRRPFGNAKSRWMKTASGRAPAARPSVNGTDELVEDSAPKNQVKPTAIISTPVRFLGRLASAKAPLPMNDQPRSSPRTPSRTV